jgi:hypothetical protein
MLRRLGKRDPRTVAREVVGLFDAVFPRLLPGFVVYLNRADSHSCTGCEAVDEDAISESHLQRAMLFELALAAGETLLATGEIHDWEACFQTAASRQRRFYDARVPSDVSAKDKEIALSVARNLVVMLRELAQTHQAEIRVEPKIPGYGWIDTGVGDYSVGHTIVEVKCKADHFTSSDYRQVLMYWLLSLQSSLANDTETWRRAALLNPRLNFAVSVDFGKLIPLVSGGRSLLEISHAFSAMVLHEWSQ